MVTITEKRTDGIIVLEMENEKLRVRLMNLGAHVLSVFTEDRDGNAADIILGYADLADYYRDENRYGAVVGRVANRIRDARFTLNGRDYLLSANDGTNHLHGGICGFEKKLFSCETAENEVCFTYLSPDGEEGYPGNLTLRVRYRLEENDLWILYDAVCDQDTLINVTNHMYFNLSGMQEKIYDHELYIAADRFAAIREGCVPNGEYLKVEGTPFDFRTGQKIGDHINDPDSQLTLAAGYDHAFILQDTKTEPQIVLRHERSGRSVSITTDMPTVQVYTGNWIAGEGHGKHGRPYETRDGIALETQFLPDSIHLQDDPPVILKAGEAFHSETGYRFN